MENTKTITTNKSAYHEYFVVESFEAGIELTGTEIKSIRQGGVNLKDAWCSVDNGQMFIKQMHISPYEHGNIFNKDPMRVRRLLLHKREIMRLFGLVKQQGLALVPLSLYFKGSLVKVQLGLCNMDTVPHHHGNGFFKRLLHCGQIFLHLPTVICKELLKNKTGDKL